MESRDLVSLSRFIFARLELETWIYFCETRTFLAVTGLWSSEEVSLLASKFIGSVAVTSHSSCVFLHLFSSANISPVRFVLHLMVMKSTKQVLALQPVVCGNLQPGLPSLCNDSGLHLSFSNHSKVTAVTIHQANQSQWFICTSKLVSYFDTSSVLIQIESINLNRIYLNKDWRCVEHETSFLVQINYCDWFAWCTVTAVTLLLLLNGNGNGLLFHMTQPTSRSTIKAISCSKPTISEN